MKKLIFLMLGMIFAIADLPAQAVLKNFDRVYGSTGVDRPYRIFYENGRTFVFGIVHKASNTVGNVTDLYGQSDMNVVIYNNNGSIFKQMTFGGNRMDSLVDVFQKDSVFIMVGVSKSDNGTGNKDADGSVLTNDVLSPINNNPYGGYAELYLVAIDTKGLEVGQLAIPVTPACYSNTNPYDLKAIYQTAINNTGTTYRSYTSGPHGLTYDYYEYKNLLNVIGVALDGNYIKIITTEASRIQEQDFIYYNALPHNSGWNCALTYTMNIGFGQYATGVQRTEYSINTNLGSFNIDKESFADYRVYDANQMLAVGCPNGCSHPSSSSHNVYVEITPRYDASGYGGTNSDPYNPNDFLGDFYTSPLDGNYYVRAENMPNITGAWFVNGKWMLGTYYPWTFDPDGTNSYQRVFPGGHYRYMIGGYNFSSPNNIDIQPVDVFYNNGKFYITIMDQTTLSTVFNASTPSPSGYSAYTHAGFVRDLVQAPTTTVPNNVDWWIAEMNGAPNPNPLYQDIQPFILSAPTRQGSIRANGLSVLVRHTPVFDTSKVFYCFGSNANIQYDKHTANKGGIDYWPVKFDTRIMKCTWDTTIGGPGDDVICDLVIKDGILAFTGVSTSPIGVDKTQPPFSAFHGDYWTLNYCISPTANFVANQNVIGVGGLVQFQNQSVRASSYTWTFADNTGTYTDVNPSHYFNNPGSYTVTLKADNGVCSNTKTRPNYIIVSGYVGIDEVTGEEIKMIYPNPSNGTFQMDRRGEIVKVIDVLGKEVRFSNQDNKIEVFGESGAFIVYYKVEDKMYSEKLIIQK